MSDDEQDQDNRQVAPIEGAVGGVIPKVPMRPRSNSDSSIPDSQMINILNELRRRENRDPVSVLPQGYTKMHNKYKFQHILRWTKEIDMHKKLRKAAYEKDLEYNNQIFFNTTELNRYIRLKASKLTGANQAENYLSLPEIALEDIPLYYPTGTDTSRVVFVTDTLTSQTTTPSFSTAIMGYVATHSFKEAETRSTSTESFDETTEEELRRLREQFKLKDSKWQKVDPVKHPTPIIQTVDNPKHIEELANLKEQVLILQNQLKQSDKEKQINREKEKELSKRHTGKTDKETITTLSQIVKGLIENVQEVKQGQLTDKANWETLKQQLPSDTSITITNKLERPNNIIERAVHRQQETLSILKPSMVISTIGTFDPDNEFLNDFKGIWDSILDHTREYLLYEHEYISILKMVMKGTAASNLRLMIRERLDIDEILSAIQDLYVPEQTFFDDYGDINKFVRKANEPIRACMRRAKFVINPLSKTVPDGVWVDKSYTILIGIMRQLIEKKTANHLKAKEVESLYAGGAYLNIESAINIVSLYETTHDCIPKAPIRLTYNIYTMSLCEQPEPPRIEEVNEIQLLREEVQMLKLHSLEPKRPRLEKRRHNGESAQQKPATQTQSQSQIPPTPPPPPPINYPVAIRPPSQVAVRPSSQQYQSQSYEQPQRLQPDLVKQIQHAIFGKNKAQQRLNNQRQLQSQSQSQSQSQEPMQWQSSQPRQEHSYTPGPQYIKPQQPNPPTQPSQPTPLTVQQYHANRGGYSQRGQTQGFQPQSQHRQEHVHYSSNDPFENLNPYKTFGYRGRGNYRGRRNRYRGRSPRETYNFERQNCDVTLNFYACKYCEDAHPHGKPCPTVVTTHEANELTFQQSDSGHLN